MPKYNLKQIIIIPTLFFILLLAIVLNTYIALTKEAVEREYGRIYESLQRSSKIVIALDYNISQIYKQDEHVLSEYDHQLDWDPNSQLCSIRPKKKAKIELNILPKEKGGNYLNYSFMGIKELCDPTTETYQIATNKFILAPMLSLLYDYENYLHGIYFISKSKYVISSPKDIISNLTYADLGRIYSRQYWQDAAKPENRHKVIYTPPYVDMSADHAEVLTFSTPVYYKDTFKGVLIIDLSVEDLLYSDSHISDNIRLLNTNKYENIENYYFMKAISLDSVDFDYFLYYKTTIKEFFKEFFFSKNRTLILIVLAYILAIVFMFYHQNRVLQLYYRKLAERDSMTGLHNRRGFEESLANNIKDRYIAFVMFDIDDFKNINDTYGHDIGDKAIKYVARMINRNLRDSDISARFGGEEFVICLNIDSLDSADAICERIRASIQNFSESIVPESFTISGGGVILESSEDFIMDDVMKEADILLYKAKKAGKNRIYFS